MKEYKTCDKCCYDILDNEGDVMEHECLEEETEYTCCWVEITSTIRDVGICPTCLEHI